MSGHKGIAMGFGETTGSGTCKECGLPTGGGLCEQHPQAGGTFESTTKMTVLQTQLNALKFFAADHYLNGDPLPGSTGEIYGEPTAVEILDYLCGDGVNASSDKIARRYAESKTAALQFVPDMQFFRDKLLVPLREAQTSYMIGNWLSTIALCGVTCEMLTMLMFEITKPHLQINGKCLEDRSVQQAVLGMDFGKLPQEGKLRLFKMLGIMGDASFEKLDFVRSTRNEYVHFYSHNPAETTKKAQALKCLLYTTDIAKNMIVIGMQDGGIVIEPYLMTYIEQQATDAGRK